MPNPHPTAPTPTLTLIPTLTLTLTLTRHVLYFMVLLAICYLWSPSKNNRQYAYMDELGQEADMHPEDEELN